MKLRRSSSGAWVELAGIVGRGGEGAVYAVSGSSAHVAKIYESPPDDLKRDKLSTMAGVAVPQLTSIAAWPIDLLKDSRDRVTGFLMPRVVARADIHEVYSPKSRAQEFPEADFRFLLHVATNISRAVATVHKHGHVIGDINHGSILVGNDGTVILIDCDSFQVNSNGQTFCCDVGVPLFTPPELHGIPFRGLRRSTNHDAFGLAVLLFHLLFMGRHPYAGRFLGHGDMPIERAIREFRFAYGTNRQSLQMESPPGTLPLAAVGPELSGLFEQAFGRNGSASRPTAVHWIAALERTAQSLKRCQKQTTHYYRVGTPGCPWCVIENASGSRLFGQRIVVPNAGATISVRDLWSAIESVTSPGPAPNVWQTLSIEDPNRLSRSVRKLTSGVLAIAGLVGCAAVEGGSVAVAFVSFFVAYFVWPHVSQEMKQRNENAKRNWDVALEDWNKKCGDAQFQTELQRLQAVRRELADLPNERTKRLNLLQARRETNQRSAYLDRYRIDRAKIPLVGPTRVAMLASYGVETAADIEPAKIKNIPGFGTAITRHLLDWRAQHERNFRFNPNEAVDPREIANVERDVQLKQINLIQDLKSGAQRLSHFRAEAISARERLKPIVERAWREKEWLAKAMS